MVISFGSVEGGRQWLDVTGCHFDMLLDTDRKVCRVVLNLNPMLSFSVRKHQMKKSRKGSLSHHDLTIVLKPGPPHILATGLIDASHRL